MQNRKMQTLNEEEILENARVRSRQVAQRAGLNIKSNWPVI
jgi:hypothetical protein